MSRNKRVGATFGKSTPHEAQAVLLGNGVSLFDFVNAGDVLCQISDIQIQSDLSLDDAKAIANGHKRTALHDVIAKLDVLIRRSQPVMPGSPVKPATVDEIIEFLLGSNSLAHHINLGRLLRREDVGFYLGGLFLNNHLAIIGMIGTGKSNSGKIILKQITWKGARAIVIDPHGEYLEGKIINVDNFKTESWGCDLDAVLKRLRASIPEKQEKILDRVSKVVRHTMENESIDSYIKACDEEHVHGGSTIKEDFMSALWTESLINKIYEEINEHDYSEPLIFNLKGLKKINSQPLVKYICDLILEMGKKGKGAYLFIDEAQTFVPQRGTPECKTAIIDLITEGRKFNCGVVLLTQRPARVDKDVLSQCNSKIIHRLTNENDIKQVRASTEYSSKQMFDEVQKLRKGEALMVSSAMERPVFIKVDEYKGGN